MRRCLSGCHSKQTWPTSVRPEGPSHYAARCGDMATLSIMRRMGLQWDYPDILTRAVRSGHPTPVLRWLVEEGAPLGSVQSMEGAVASAVGWCGMGAEDAAWLRGVAAEHGSG